jgi:hypothetical protein
MPASTAIALKSSSVRFRRYPPDTRYIWEHLLDPGAFLSLEIRCRELLVHVGAPSEPGGAALIFPSPKRKRKNRHRPI